MWRPKQEHCKVARFLLFAVKTIKNIEHIEINFMESGHSVLPNDSDFSNISDAMKNESSIYSIEEYDKLIKNCKKRNQFETNRMDGKFVSHDELNAILINRKKSESGEMVQWLKIKWMQFSRGSLKMNFK